MLAPKVRPQKSVRKRKRPLADRKRPLNKSPPVSFGRHPEPEFKLAPVN